MRSRLANPCHGGGEYDTQGEGQVSQESLWATWSFTGTLGWCAIWAGSHVTLLATVLWGARVNVAINNIGWLTVGDSTLINDRLARGSGQGVWGVQCARVGAARRVWFAVATNAVGKG